jgi:hypothetical protein
MENISTQLKKKALVIFIIWYSSGLSAQIAESVVRLKPKPWGPVVWESKPPAGCPVLQSSDFAGIEFTGKSADYTYADTWYPTWASDGNLYSPYTDGVSGIWSLARSNKGKYAVTGQARITGTDPQNLEVESLGVYPGSAEPYSGRYPCGSLIYNDIWYYGTYCLDDYPAGYNFGTMGPFVGFRISKDFGKSWVDTPHSCEKGLFGESRKVGSTVKIGAPHFVDFGKNMEHSPDGKAYLIAHGAMANDPEPRPANLSWISGDQIYLTRVAPSESTINDHSKYEYFCGFDKNQKPVWTCDFSKIEPIFEWNNHCGCVTMTYDARQKKYIMCVTDGWPTVKYMNTFFLESDQIEGPWKLISYMQHFGEQGYFVNIPSKFISEGGTKAWLCYSGNFSPFPDLDVNPPGGRYGLILQQFRFLNKSELENYPYEKNREKLEGKRKIWSENNPITSSSNKALIARVSTSSVESGYHAKGVNDGLIAGFPVHQENEWASKGQKAGAWVRLEWDTEIKVSKIWLFDRPTISEHVMAGGLTFSDGTTMLVSELPNAEYSGKQISFPEKKVKWLEFTVLGVGRASNIGLAEIAVFE